MGNINTIHIPVQAQYGRSPTGAAEARDKWWSQIGANNHAQTAVEGGMGYANGQAQTPRGPQATENPGLANQEASGANGNQAGAIGLAGTLARGQQPSQAAYQLQSGLNQASAQQSAMAGGARGGAALATAGANQNANTADLQQNAYTNAGILKSQDMAAGRGMYGSLLGQQRDQDAARIGQGDQMSQANSDMNDKYALGMGSAAVGLGQAGVGQSGQDLNAFNGGMQVVDAQSEADQQRQRWLADAQKQKVSANKQDT